METDNVQVSNPPLVRVAIVLGVAFFAAGTLFGLAAAIFDETAKEPAKVTMAGLSVLFAWLCSVGYRLVPYLNQTLFLDEEGFTSDLRGRKSRYSWGSVRFRVRETFHVVEITDLSGRMISAFDFYATNANYLLQYAQNQQRVLP